MYNLERERCQEDEPARSVMVLKKLGDDLWDEFVDVINFLGRQEGLKVVVEPHEYQKLVRCTSRLLLGVKMLRRLNTRSSTALWSLA